VFVLKNRDDLELTEANFHAGLSHSKQLLKSIHPTVTASFCSLKKRYLQLTTPKNPQNGRLHIHQTRRKALRTQLTFSH